MAETVSSYRALVSGLWNSAHRLLGPDGEVGLLQGRRNGWGMVVEGEWTPAKGEKLRFRRDPGLLRSQFSVWTEGREWLGSSLRWSFRRREIVLHTGSRPLRLVPLSGFRTGWTLQAPRTGEMARFRGGLLGRAMQIEVYRKLEFELLVFAYFLVWQIRRESFWPGPALDEDPTLTPAPKAPGASGSR